MANRHLSRSIVLQTLFEWDIRDLSVEELIDVLTRNVEEFAPGAGDFSFMESLMRGVIEKRKDIDAIIEKAAPEWPIDKISVTDRNILRIGLYELLFADRNEVPAKVAINEAIELAKSFGGDNSGRFVNGVLGAVYKEIGEPGKDETSRKKKEEVPYEKMPQEKLAGAVVYAESGGDIFLALVHDIFGRWTLSKGKLEPDEELKTGTKRKIKEELGIDIELVEELGSNEYVANDPEVGKKRKQVTYYLAKAPFGELTLGSTGGLDDAKWFKLADIIDLNFYEDLLPIVTKAINKLIATGGQKEKQTKK